MKLSILPTLALTASCAANAPDIKPTDVDLNTTQTRADLLAQLGAKHEGSQDNGDFVYCTSIDDTDCGQQSTDRYPYYYNNNKRNCLREKTLLAITSTQAGFDACRKVLDPENEDKCWNEADTSVSIDHFVDEVIFSWDTLCGSGPIEHTGKSCRVHFSISDISVNDTGACARLGTASTSIIGGIY